MLAAVNRRAAADQNDRGRQHLDPDEFETVMAQTRGDRPGIGDRIRSAQLDQHPRPRRKASERDPKTLLEGSSIVEAQHPDDIRLVGIGIRATRPNHRHRRGTASGQVPQCFGRDRAVTSSRSAALRPDACASRLSGTPAPVRDAIAIASSENTPRSAGRGAPAARCEFTEISASGSGRQEIYCGVP